MEDMLDMEDIMVLAMLDMDMLDIHMPTMERDLLMLSQRLTLMLTCMELTDMELMAMMVLDIMDMLDTHMPTTERDLPMLSQRLMLMLTLPTMERDLLMLSQRLMLMLMPSMDTMDMPDLMPTEDTEATDTMERDPLMLSQRLMLTTDTMDMPDLMPLDTEVLDTEDTTWDKSYTLRKNSTKQKLKANNIQL